jgi:hypothetical protein
MEPPKTQEERKAFARRGDEIYDQAVRPHLMPEHHGQFVAIDVDSGDFEIDARESEATDRLLARRPHARMWWKRVGYRAVHRFGPSRYLKA